jgi:histidinol-phosphate aminotransferase
MQMPPPPIHGGFDVPWDFSTNANCLGPCPAVLEALRSVDVARYPDSYYPALIEKLAQWHGVHPNRVLLGASASELIGRLHMALRLMYDGVCSIAVPRPAYEDYAFSARACGHRVIRQSWQQQEPSDQALQMQWLTVPDSPLGQGVDQSSLQTHLKRSSVLHVIDCAYQPLLLEGQRLPQSLLDAAWSIWSPNKALGLCGVRGAYAIAPQQPGELAQWMRQLESSWVLGAHAQAMLSLWVSDAAQDWLAQTLEQLRDLKSDQINRLEALGIHCKPSVSNFFVVQLAQDPALHAQRLKDLMAQGVALRDTSSMGLPDWARMRVHTQPAHEAFETAWRNIA